jgi:hypothetical protein
VSRLEERLRETYRGEARTVTPESIRRLGAAIEAQAQAEAQAQRPARTGRSRPPRRRSRWVRWLAPLAAAAAVAVIVIVAAVTVPRGPAPAQPAATGKPTAKPTGTASPAPSVTPTAGPAVGAPKFLIDDATGMPPLQVRNATTGALVAHVALPKAYPGGDSRTFIGAVATGNGRDYIVAEYANPCRSWLYQFRLDSAGHPSAVTPFAPLRTVPSELYELAVSANGQMAGFTTTACQGAKAQPNYVGVIDIATGHTTRWTTPSRNSVDAVSLTADGKQLCYSLQLDASVARVIPTSAAPGIAAGIGRTVVRAGAGRWVALAQISADGSEVYYADYTEATAGNDKPMTGQIRAMDLATGRSRLLYTPKGNGGPGVMMFDSSARYLMMQVYQDVQHPARLVRLDLVTGKVAYLPSRRFALPALLYW